jgi:K+-sensing histidine kinase KdpD
MLDKIQREEEKQRGGRLKIFFGASAGVGKTFAMPQAARWRLDEGVDVVVGIVETSRLHFKSSHDCSNERRHICRGRVRVITC